MSTAVRDLVRAGINVNDCAAESIISPETKHTAEEFGSGAETVEADNVSYTVNTLLLKNYAKSRK